MQERLLSLNKTPKTWKLFLWIGVGLCILAVMVFATTGYFFSHDVSYRDYRSPLLLLVLLCFLFVGYMGPIFLFLGALLWSFTRGKFVKLTVRILLVAILFLFVPFPRVCASYSIWRCGDMVYPFQPEYWLLVRNHFLYGENPNVDWRYFGSFYLDEGFGDVAKTYLDVQETIR